MIAVIATAIIVAIHWGFALLLCKALGFETYYGMFWYFFGATVSELYTRVKYEQERREKERDENQD